MSTIHSGSCLCSATCFEVEGEFEHFYLCHCAYCRKDSGSAHAANLFSSKAQLRWIRGADKVTRFALPQTRHVRCFCSICGSALPWQMEGQLVVVPAGSLDTLVTLKPDAHLFMSSKASWDENLDGIARMERFPVGD